MSYTEIQTLLGHLRQLDEITILELLDISTEDLLDAFIDRVVDNQAKLYSQYAED